MAILQHITSFLVSSRFILSLITASFVGVILVMVNTSPIELGPGGMLLAFGVFYVWFFALLLGLSHVIRALKQREMPIDTSVPRPALSGRAVMLSSVWAFAPLVVLALQSIGQLDMVSVSLVILFEALASFYIIKR